MHAQKTHPHISLQGNQLYREGQFVQAAEKYLKAVEICPTLSFAWANLGNLYRETGQLNAALSAHLKTIEIDGTRARNYYNLVRASIRSCCYDSNYRMGVIFNYRRLLLFFFLCWEIELS